jgi:hypothetical protein
MGWTRGGPPPRGASWRPARDPEVADAGVAVGLRELRARWLPDQRVVEEPRPLGATEEAAEPDLAGGLGQEVLATDDEVDPVAKVVDDDREAVRPVPLAVTDHEVAGRTRIADLRTEQDVVKSLHSGAERDPQARARVLGECPVATAPRASLARPRASVLVRPRRERRAGAVAREDEARGREPVPCRLVGRGRVVVRLADGPRIRLEAEPREVLEQRGAVHDP